MHITIIPADKAISIDGVGLPDVAGFNWSTVSPAIHAVWFNEADGFGEIEWVSPRGGRKPANVRISRDEFMAMFGDAEPAWAKAKAALEANLAQERQKEAEHKIAQDRAIEARKAEKAAEAKAAVEVKK